MKFLFFVLFSFFYSHDRLCVAQFHCIQYDDNEDKEIIETIIYTSIFCKEKLVEIFSFNFREKACNASNNLYNYKCHAIYFRIRLI